MRIELQDLLAHSFVLTTSQSRLAAFCKRFGEKGLLPLPQPYSGRYVDRTSKEYALNKHYIAAHMSHIEICEKARQLDWPFVCIFEEDAYPCIDVSAKLEHFIGHVPDDAYVCRLGFVPCDGTSFPTTEDWTPMSCPEWAKSYSGGSHAYVVFKSFFSENARMLQTYEDYISHVKESRPLHHPNQLDKNEVGKIWFYEWLMAPYVCDSPFADRIYSVGDKGNMFAQYPYIKWNPVTRQAFSRRLSMDMTLKWQGLKLRLAECAERLVHARRNPS